MGKGLILVMLGYCAPVKFYPFSILELVSEDNLESTNWHNIQALNFIAYR